MFKDSRLKIIGRIRRSGDRFKNAKIDLGEIIDVYLERIQNSKDLKSASKHECEFNEFCRNTFPIRKDEIASLSNVNQLIEELKRQK